MTIRFTSHHLTQQNPATLWKRDFLCETCISTSLTPVSHLIETRCQKCEGTMLSDYTPAACYCFMCSVSTHCCSQCGAPLPPSQTSDSMLAICSKPFELHSTSDELPLSRPLTFKRHQKVILLSPNHELFVEFQRQDTLAVYRMERETFWSYFQKIN